MSEIDTREFDLLLNEKDHVDSQISSFLDLEIKILTFLFPALGVAVGWMFKSDVSDDGKAKILVGAAAAACFGILMSIGTYATAIAYIRYKTAVLGEKFKKILSLPKPPFETREWFGSPGGKVLNATTLVIWLLVLIFTLSLLASAWRLTRQPEIHELVIVCSFFLAVAVLLAMLLGWAILTAGKIAEK